MENFQPKSRQEILGYEIAQNLGDIPNLTLYIACCKKHPEYIVRQVYDQVMTVPIEKINKSRSVLFHYLIHKYAQKKYTYQNISDQTGE